MSSLDKFDFQTGRVLSGKYKVLQRLGVGWEAEVYLVQELATNIERAAKVFFPKRNPSNRTVKRYATKLHKLRACNSLIKYISVDHFQIAGQKITYLLSEFVEGQTLDTYLKTFSRRPLPYYQALHLFYAIVKAAEEIHIHKEAHGDIHGDNIIVQKQGLNYELKLIDVFLPNAKNPTSIQHDVIDLCHLLYQIIGGVKHYQKQPPIIKEVCCGLKHSLITKKFRNTTNLRTYLENSHWD